MSRSKNPYPKFMEGVYAGYRTVPVEAVEDNGWYQVYRYTESGRKVVGWKGLRWYDLDRLIQEGALFFSTDQLSKEEKEFSVDLLEII